VVPGPSMSFPTEYRTKGTTSIGDVEIINRKITCSTYLINKGKAPARFSPINYSDIKDDGPIQRRYICLTHGLLRPVVSIGSFYFLVLSRNRRNLGLTRIRPNLVIARRALTEISGSIVLVLQDSESDL